jgi:mevalonate kinase
MIFFIIYPDRVNETHSQKNRFKSLRFILTDTRVPKNTKRQLDIVQDRVNQYPQVMQPLLQAIEAIIQKCKELFQKESTSEEGIYASLNVSHHHHPSLSCLSSPELS